MYLSFTKMHGAGNDFALLDARVNEVKLDPDQIRAMADRHTGIGFDQLLIVTAPCVPGCVAGYRIANPDGSSAEQCGNGARCIAAWLHRDGVIELRQPVQLDSPAGPIGAQLLAPLDVSIEMGEPDFDPAHAGFDGIGSGAVQLELGDQTITVRAVSMGNPHAVVEVDDVADPALAELGPALTRHPRFRNGCNAGFARVVGPQQIDLRVHERGAGWTLACGSGACAAAAAMIAAGRCNSPVQVRLPGGRLDIEWAGPGHPLWMRGPAAFVFEGRWPLS